MQPVQVNRPGENTGVLSDSGLLRACDQKDKAERRVDGSRGLRVRERILAQKGKPCCVSEQEDRGMLHGQHTC